MRVLIIGASGRVGKRIVESALRNGHNVIALVRNPKSIKEIQHDNLAVVKGSPTNVKDLQQCFQLPGGLPGAVLTALASSTKPMAPENFMRDTLKSVVNVMKEFGVKRLVCLSAFGVGASEKNFAFLLKLMFNYTRLATGYRDHQAVEVMLKGEQGIQWTLVKPPMLKDDSEVKATRTMGAEGAGMGMFDSCTTGSVADFIVKVAEEDTYTRESIVIAN